MYFHRNEHYLTSDLVIKALSYGMRLKSIVVQVLQMYFQISRLCIHLSVGKTRPREKKSNRVQSPVVQHA